MESKFVVRYVLILFLQMISSHHLDTLANWAALCSNCPTNPDTTFCKTLCPPGTNSPPAAKSECKNGATSENSLPPISENSLKPTAPGNMIERSGKDKIDPKKEVGFRLIASPFIPYEPPSSCIHCSDDDCNNPRCKESCENECLGYYRHKLLGKLFRRLERTVPEKTTNAPKKPSSR